MDAKFLRKQIRNVIQEEGKEFLTSEVGTALETKLLAEMNARLDSIDKYCQQALEKQDKRSKAIQTFIIQEVTGRIQNDLFNANVTIDAVVEVLAEAGLSIENFAGKVDEKKVIIADRQRKAADEQMKAQMEARAALAQVPAQAPVSEEKPSEQTA